MTAKPRSSGFDPRVAGRVTRPDRARRARQLAPWAALLLPFLAAATPIPPPPAPPPVQGDTGADVRPAFAPTGTPTEWPYHKTADGHHPDDNEQALLWLMNRARQDPTREGVWLATSDEADVVGGRDFFRVDLDRLRAEFAAYPPAPPAAFDVRLYRAAREHSLDLIARDAQDHDGQFDRLRANGFRFRTARGSVFSFGRNPLHAHAAFNIDWGGSDGTGMQTGRGHRLAIMSPRANYSNVGIAMVPEARPNTAVGPFVITANYCEALADGVDHFNRFIVGTVWRDGNGNDRYDPGEGLPGVKVTPDRGRFYAVTAAGGGYAFPATEAGEVSVRFTAAGITAGVATLVEEPSVLLDLRLDAPPPPEPRAGAGEPMRIATSIDGEVALTTRDRDGTVIVLIEDRARATWIHKAFDGPDAPRADAPGNLWFDPKDGLLNLAIPSFAGLMLYTRGTDGTWTAANLSRATGADATPIVTAPTHFISPDLARNFDGTLIVDARGDPLYPIPPRDRNNVHLAGLNASGDLVLYAERRDRDDGPTYWAYTNLTLDHLLPTNQTLPRWTGDLVGYVTPWNGRNIAGLDAAGQIAAVWTAPDRQGVWAATNLSGDLGTPRLAGGLSAYVNWGINLPGVLPDGRLGITWWSAQLERERIAAGRSDLWAFSNLSTEADGPRLKATSIASYSTPNRPSAHILGLDQDGALVRYWWTPDHRAEFGVEWRVEDITQALPNAEAPVRALAAVAGRDDRTTVVGIGADGDILHYLQPAPGAAWRFRNLTETAGH